MKIVIYAMGTFGDISPLVDIGCRLADNFDVVVISCEKYRGYILSKKLEFISVVDSNCHDKVYGDSETWKLHSKVDHFGEFHAPLVEKTFNEISDIFKATKELHIVSQSLFDGAYLAAQKFNIPYTHILLSPAALFSEVSPTYPLCEQIPSEKLSSVMPRIKNMQSKYVMDHWITPTLNPLRQSLDLELITIENIPSVHDVDNVYALFPKWLKEPPVDWPKHIVYSGFSLAPFDSDGNEAISEFLEEHKDPFVFTFGTGFPATIDLVDNAKTLCEIFDAPCVFVSKSFGASFFHRDDRCLVVGEADFDMLFQKAKIVYHHGGIGTSASCLLAGARQIIMPLSFDQPDNAFNLFKLGVANATEMINDSIVDLIELTEEVINNDEYYKSAKRYRNLMINMSGADVVAKDILNRYL